MPKQVKAMLRALQIAQQAENYLKSKGKIQATELHNACSRCLHFLPAAGDKDQGSAAKDQGRCAMRGGGADEEHPVAAAFRSSTCKGELFKTATSR